MSHSYPTTLLTRQVPTSFQELNGLLADHDFMVKKNMPTVTPVQAFATTAKTRSTTASSSAPDTLQALQQLVSQLGLQLQPAPSTSPQSFDANWSSSSRGCGSNNLCGSGSYSQSSGGTHNQFSWASTQKRGLCCMQPLWNWTYSLSMS